MRVPSNVIQIDPVRDPLSPAPGFDLIGQLDQHRASSLLKTLEAAHASHIGELRRTLPMSKGDVLGYLRRGAKIVWDGGKAIVWAGKNIGPVGLAGRAWDLYSFIQWVNSIDVDLPQPVPDGVFQPASNAIEFTWPDGTVTVAPVGAW